MTGLFVALGLLGGTLTYSLPPAKPEQPTVLAAPQPEKTARLRRPTGSIRPDLELERPIECGRTLARKVTRYGTIRIGAACQSPAVDGRTGS